VLYCGDRPDRLRGLAGLTLARRRRRLGLYFVTPEKNVSAEELEAFLRSLQRPLRRPLLGVLDRASLHR